MSINARTVKEVLRLQFLNKMDYFSDQKTSDYSSGSDSDFISLLESMISGQSNSRSATGPAMELKQLSVHPVELLAKGYVPVQIPETKSGPTEYNAIIERASRKFGVEPSLVKAVIRTESNFKPDVVSLAGAKGMMQLMDETGRGLGVTDPLDAEQNITGGTKFLSALLKKYNGNTAMALAAYNVGPGRIDALGAANDNELMSKLHLLPQETQKYIPKVLAFKKQFEAV